jgi:hypothetical protein
MKTINWSDSNAKISRFFTVREVTNNDPLPDSFNG